MFRRFGGERGSRTRSPGRLLAAALAAALSASSVRAQPAPAPAPPTAQPEAPTPVPPPPGTPGETPPPPAPAPLDPGLPPDAPAAPPATPEGAPPAPANTPPPHEGADSPHETGSAPDDISDAERSDDGNDTDSLKYTLDGIEVRGNTKTRARVVLRYVPFRAGDVFDVDSPQVELTRYRLLGTGFFRDVQLALRKGKRRGHVVLIIEVVERNTLVVNDLWMGLAADAETGGKERPLTAYAGIDVAETNLVGTGITLGTAVGIAQDQFALRLRFLDPAFLGSRWMTSGTLLYNNADDFFGLRDVRFDAPGQDNPAPRGFAVVQYKRFGGVLGVGRDLSLSTQFWVNYRLEGISANVPSAATETRGMGAQAMEQPIDFHVMRGQSILSTLSATLQHDTRDKPILTTHGWFVSATTEVSLSPLGSDYTYQRLDGLAQYWWTLPWHHHVMRLRMYGGAISGRAPFFEQYYVGDLSDFRAPRVLGLNFERRPAPNFFDTDIAEVRRGDYAGKIDLEYRVPVYHGTRSVYGIDLFARFGVYAIAGHKDVLRPPGGYSGAALFPIDFTANLGVQMDTSAGGFTFSLANILGFIPALSEDR